MQLQDFPLAWRWTDEKYALLPQDVLAQIRPHSAALADQLFQNSLAFNASSGLDERIFACRRIETLGIEPERVTDWLLDCHGSKDTCVFVSWQPNTAASTTWGVFARYWDAFCYPVSDNVNVWSDGGNWALLYHHTEFMQFGERLEA